MCLDFPLGNRLAAYSHHSLLMWQVQQVKQPPLNKTLHLHTLDTIVQLLAICVYVYVCLTAGGVTLYVSELPCCEDVQSREFQSNITWL